MPSHEEIADAVVANYQDELYPGGELEMVRAAVLDALSMAALWRRSDVDGSAVEEI
jgi:hypothetical protein